MASLSIPLPSGIALDAGDIKILHTGRVFKQTILDCIRNAKKRISIAALYIQDDEAGSEILHALFQAKQQNPSLDIKVFVDFHRAQRGLIGEKQCSGNRGFYQKLAEEYSELVEIYGVTVKSKEVLGVLHLKGFVFDDTVLYSGASLNNVYLYQKDEYRCDRYYCIQSSQLAQCLVNYLNEQFVDSRLAMLLTGQQQLNKKQVRYRAKQQKALLRRSQYKYIPEALHKGQLTVTPLVGLGARGNLLNRQIRNLLRMAEQQLVIFTPYFNLPNSLKVELKRALKRGVQVKIIVGDKQANDFYISDEDKFSTIGIVPYIYETLLKRFVRKFHRFIVADKLEVRLWQDGSNSFHLKGIVVDEKLHLLTGNNLNPRAWSLDLENGLMFHDPEQLLKVGWQQELANIEQQTRKVTGVNQLQHNSEYPIKVQKLLKRLKVTAIDRILKRIL
ncbi:CDP-diacylglycerol--serine O-phosphatidyltransferase [Motiliproteus sp. MSK22-1]|uniref:CDP-diacylglycerol--serine O-phosphatidyltransferase n=1 Tax=Motiliproteus sp. MSK22-1 TaxID=1897630 RepID=UPI000975CAAC|nr:CDP-diacylglycerol--serine O-phosphatidyltransferase [Motiliproteus sp. MSK22-1]OMH29174.1 phosphatidylserine synthase [Motiliproteus sp. MSK22-1]